MSDAARVYLQRIEYSMGNGQCHECGGSKPGEWAPHPWVPTKADEGHRKDCLIALALIELGCKIKYRKEPKKINPDQCGSGRKIARNYPEGNNG